MISDKTLYNCAFDICEKITLIESVSVSPMPLELKMQVVHQQLCTLNYISLFVNCSGTKSSVDSIIKSKTPDLLDAWNKIHSLMMSRESNNQKSEMQFEIVNTDLANSMLNSIINK